MIHNGTRRWAALLFISFIIHTALSINSTETALWNEQSRQGNLLAQQFADAAAPLVLARDRVSLSVLINRYENNSSIASARVFNTRHELISQTLDSTEQNRLFRAPLQVEQQILGHIELRLPQASSSTLVRLCINNIALSSALHALIFFAGLFLSAQKKSSTTPATSPMHSSPKNSPHAHEHTDAAPSPIKNQNQNLNQNQNSTLLHIALDDPNGLLTRVNAAMADELLSLFDQFIDRAARLYGGSVTTPFSANGVVLRFTQADSSDREFHAIAAAQLFLQLVAESQEERRQHGRLCLNCKAGVLHNRDSNSIAAMMANTALSQKILSNIPSTTLGNRCQLGVSHQLAISEHETLPVAHITNFIPDYQQLINNQCQQILRPAESAE